MAEASEYIELIDQKYLEAKMIRISRFSVEWGKWSREMNLGINELTKSKTPQVSILKYVFVYWINRSKLLELYHKSKMGKLGLKKRLEKEGQDLKKSILSGKLPKMTNENMKETILKDIRKKR